MAQSKLLQILSLLYRMQDDDQQQLESELLAMRKRAWRLAITEEARQMGYNIVPEPPSGIDLLELKAMCAEDAKSIANTWNRDVSRQLEKLYKANPRGNRQYYIKNMETWARARGVWKNASIALNTEQSTIQYAKTRFWQMNGLRGGRFAASGPPPTCEVCVKIFAAGVVDFAYTQRRPFPAHVNCPHTYKIISRGRPPLSELWIG